MKLIHATSRFGIKRLKKTVTAMLTAFFVVGLVAPVLPVQAALHGFAAQEMIRTGHTVDMQPGEVKDFTIAFKNTGSTTWSSVGGNFVSIYTYEPKYRQSVFRDSSWYRADQPTKVTGSVAPGQLGFIRFKLRAPSAEGSHRETFHLAAENLAWIPGGKFSVDIGKFSVDINVRRVYTPPPAPTPVPAQPAANTVNVSNDRSAYSASEISRSANTVHLQPGEKQLFTISYKNTGQATWLPDGRRFVSIYTYDPKYRTSVFEDSSWYRSDQPARIASLITAPGNVGEVKLYLKAPSSPGTYSETFRLASEDLVWIPGGQFTVNIVVGGSGSTAPTPVTPAPAPVVPPTVTSADGYNATMMLATGDRVKMNAGSIEDFRVAFKNSGVLPWVKYGNEPIQLKAVSANAQSFRDETWNGDYATILAQDRIDSGQLAFFNFRLRAPSSGGLYTARFTLHAGDRPIDGGIIEIPVEVAGGSGSVGTNVPYDSSSEFPNAGPKGPNIRVGLFKSISPVTFVSSGTYQLIDGRDHQAVRQLSGVTTVTFNFQTLQYTVTNGSFVHNTSYHVHLRPDNMDSTIFEIPSYENRAAWDRTVNYNKFRGDISVHYMRSTGNLWVIEELPIEDYMRGLAETSNGSPAEYQKALVTAARTYALYVILIGGKHKSEYHDVNTTAGDQVYKGYISETIRPNVVAAVENTRGSIVTYNNELVVTPYYSRSDGRTRAWSEVWGGSKPWCVSVPTPYDQGKTLWGHGVGMSASDALGRARDGATWTDILRYYYTGTQIKRIY